MDRDETVELEKSGMGPDTVASAMPSNTPAASQEAAVSHKGPELDADGRPKRSFVTMGEHIHNEVTYRGIDWLLNSIAGVSFAFWTTRTHSGQKYFSQPVTGFFRKILSPVFKQEKDLKQATNWANMFLSIMFGGTVTIPPIMAMENHGNKKGIVRFFDNLIYGKQTVENDPRFARAYEEIEYEPRKDFGAGMLSRAIALTPLVALTVIPKTHGWIERHFYDHIANATEWMAKTLRIQPKKMMNTLQRDANGKMVSDWKFLHHTMGFDFGLTVFYSVLHEIAYKSVARIFSNRREEKAALQEIVAEHQATHRSKNPQTDELEPSEPAPENDPKQDANTHSPVTKVARVENLSRVVGEEAALGQGA